MKSVSDLARAKRERRPFTVVTAYDVLAARAVAHSEVDAILVGDSVAMVVHGHPSTVHATVDLIALHTAAVRRGAPDRLVIADMPFLSMRRGLDFAVNAAGALIQAGANAVKVEGASGHLEIVAHLVESGIPVLGHLGLTPQSVHQLGYRVQGRDPNTAARVRRDAADLENAGIAALVLECVPASLAAELAAMLTVPTIGIGAGCATDGQVLVITDLLGLDPEFRPAFARAFANGHAATVDALNAFAREVREARFPAPSEVPA